MGMFDRFKKKREVLDLVELKKRGLIQDSDLGIEEEKIVDLSSLNQKTSTGAQNPFEMLNRLAEASASEPGKKEFELDSVGLKKKFRDRLIGMEDRIDSLSVQIQKVADRVDLVERKLERKS